MAKKNDEKFSLKKFLNKFMEKSVQSIIAVISENSEQIITWIKNLSSLSKKIKRLAFSLVFLVAGLVLAGFGLSELLASMYPGLANGLSHILIGAVLLLLAALYTKASD